MGPFHNSIIIQKRYKVGIYQHGHGTVNAMTQIPVPPCVEWQLKDMNWDNGGVCNVHDFLDGVRVLRAVHNDNMCQLERIINILLLNGFESVLQMRPARGGCYDTDTDRHSYKELEKN